MSAPEQRASWRQRATWLTQLGLDPDDSTPVDAVEDVADAVLALLEEVAALEDERDEARRIGAWLYDHSPGTRLFLGDISEWPWLMDDVEAVQGPEGATSPRLEAPMTSATDFVDHDHSAEAALLDYVDSPTADNAHTAELAIALLQRRFDALLRRLDGDAVPPFTPPHTHNAWDMPEACLEGSLTELAEGSLEDRAATLAHGQEALRALSHHLDEARRCARLLYHRSGVDVADTVALEAPSDLDDWPEWLTSDGGTPERQEPAPG